jgi:hypothetical protein
MGNERGLPVDEESFIDDKRKPLSNLLPGTAPASEQFRQVAAFQLLIWLDTDGRCTFYVESNNFYVNTVFRLTITIHAAILKESIV